MTLQDAITGWLSNIDRAQEKTAQAAQAVKDDPDPAMPPGRLLIDGKATRQAILDTVQASVAKRFPVENDNYRIELNDVRYEGPTHYTLEQQKQALLHNRKLGCSLAGTWRLIDKKTGKVIEEKRDAVMRVPYYTNRGTIINNGSEYTVISQARLSPGVYTRRKQNGDLESQFNVANGKGFRLELDKSTGRIGMRMGQANLPLYPVLKAFGIDDKTIAKSWGSDVALANATKNDPKAMQKLYEHVSGYKYDPLMTPSNQAAYVKDELSRFGLDPNTVVRTLGLENVTGVTPEVLLRASQKLLNVNRGAEEPDNRDNPRFSKFYGVEHMLGERIDKDAAKLLKPMLFRVGRDKSLARVGRNALGAYIDDFLSTSGLAQPGEEANPMSILVQQSRITRTGEGGISSPELITPEARGVQGDYLGFVDYIAGPESAAAGVDVRGAYGTVIGKDNKLYNVFRNLRTGKKEYLSLDQAADKVIAFPDQDLKSPYLYCMRNGVPDRVKTSEVDYMVPSFARTLGAGINMNPMPTAIFGMRSFYSSKFWEQYLPQKNGEVPLVDSLMPDGKMTFNEYYGRKAGCVTAPFSGTVTAVTKDGITVAGKDGKTETFDLVTNLPHNRMTQFTLFPLVKKGQEVREGDLLAHSNFTDPKTGAFNMGQNLKVAILPGARNANSFEDACWISASAAKRLSTSRLYNFDQDTKNGVRLGKNKYLAAFPSSFTKQQAETLDDSGVVKVGTELHRGDPIIVATGPKLLSAENAQLGKLSSVLKNAVTDKAQTWNHDWPGVVTDVVAGPNGAKVLIKSEPPVKVADKLSPRGALKGVTGTVLDDDKMPRDAVTNEPYDMLVNPMGFLSRVAPGQLMEIALGKVAKKTGRQIRIPQLPPPEGWLNWTKRQLAENGVSETADVFDPQTGRTIKGVGDGYMYVQAMHHLAEKKYSARGLEGGYTQDQQPAKGGETGSKKMCFTADQVVRVLHGEEKIGHICEKRIPAYVWTRFDDGSWGYSIVTNWFVRKGKMSEVLDVIVDGLPGFDRSGQKKVVYVDKALHVTKQHHVFSPDRGEILAGDLRPGDWLTSYGYVPTEDQMSILIGSMLGDGCICNVNDHIRKQANGKLVGSLPFYQERHSHHQYDYVNWKIQSLGALVSSRKNTQGKSRSGFRRKDGTDTRVAYYQVHRHDIAETLKNMFYRQSDGTLGRKNLSFVDLERINDAGIAAFFLDDGHIAEHVKNGRKTGSPTGGISTLGFTEEENEKLAVWLSGRLDADVHVGKCHTRVGDEIRYYSNLYLSADACRKMARLVAKYVPLKAIPKTKKWLIGEVSRLQDLYVGIDTHYALGSVPVLVTSVKPYNDGRHGPDDDVCLYDMTVEKSHKYCASDCLVSNSGFDQNALLSHGATEVLKDAMTVRGTQNQEYWRALRLGLPIPEPGVPFIYTKFLNNLRAGGINVVEKGDVTSLLPQTDESIEQLAEGRVIDSSQMVDADFDPVKGGLFDLGKTGGMGGLRWSMIQLPEPVPNPVMEEPVRRILGLTVKGLSDVLSGKQELNGKTGGTAVKEALANLDIGQVMRQAQSDIRTKRGSARDNAVKVLGYLQAAERMKVSPKDWMITKVPVIPPAFRPISKAGNVALVPDTNELYKELLETKHNYEILKEDLPDSALTDERLNVYKAVKAAFGLGNSVTAEGQAKNLKGPIRQIIGTVPKWGQFQSKVVAKNQDLVGRSVTVPDKNLSMDQIGIPEDMAWTMYKPFVTRGLVQRGYAPVDAIKMIDERTPTARHILDDVMREKPVLMDRAPTWHKFNIMAFKPFIVDGKEIRVCPMIDSGYNMDHDGDFSNSPYITTFISNEILENRPLTSESDLCYNPPIIKPLIGGRSMKKESVVINGQNTPGVVVNLRWDEFPHYDNPTVNRHPNANFYLVPEGVCVRAYDEQKQQLVWAPVKYWSHHGVNEKLEVVTVELSSGRQILTDDDPRGVYGIDPDTLTFGRWRPSEAVGKFVPRCIKDSCQNETVTVVETEYTNRERPIYDMPLDRLSGWFMGAMVGDGWNTREHDVSTGICFCFDKKYNDLGDAYRKAVCHALFGDSEPHMHENVQLKVNDDARYGDAMKISINSSAAGRFIDTMIGHGAENKHLPPFWQNAPKEFKLGLFEGLLDTDGTLAIVKAKAKRNPQLMCNYSTVSMTLAAEVQYLCRTLGVDSKLTAQKTPAGGRCWQLSISTKNLKALGLELKSPHKAKALAEAEIQPEASAGGRKYMIPVPKNELKRVSSLLLALDKAAYVTLNRTGKLGYAPTTIADKIARILKATPELQTDAWKRWMELYENLDSVVWERVEGFTNTGMFEEGFDLTVPGYETFMNAEGIILSNTVNIHVPASEKASKEALEKMLPSKNLFSLTDMESVRYKPEKEQVSGLWALTSGMTKKPVKAFASKAEAIRAYRNGEIGPNDPVEIRT